MSARAQGTPTMAANGTHLARSRDLEATMSLRLRPLAEQVIVITGASSGIGLVTAKRAALQGARVVLASRNERDLAAAVHTIREHGGRAIHCTTDVSDEGQVKALGAAALAEFGRVDTW